MDYNYESNGIKRNNFNSEGTYQRSDDIISHQRYNRGLGPHNAAVAGINSRYHELGGISSPTVAAAAPQTPSSSFSRPQFKTPFFRPEHTAIYNGEDCNVVPLETPGTPQSHYGQQYGYRPPLAAASPNIMAAVRPAAARYGNPDQVTYSHYPEQLISHESLEPIRARPSMHCEPSPHYGIPSNRPFQNPDRRQPPHLAQRQPYDEAPADSRPFAHEGALPKRHYHEIEQMWKGLEKEVAMKDVPNRQYRDMEPLWKGPDTNMFNGVLKDNNRPNERQYKEREAVWKGMGNGAMLKDIPNRRHQESGAMWGGKDKVISKPQSPSPELTPKNEPYNYDQSTMYATKSIKEENVNRSPIVMMKAESKVVTVQLTKSVPRDDNYRVLSGPLSQVIKWEKMRGQVPSLIEVVAPFVAVHPSSLKGDKMIILREMSCPALQCLFQEIDRPLPTFQPGQLVRCVGKMLAKNKMRAFSVRAAHAAEKASLQRLQFVCNRVLHEAFEGSEPPQAPT